MFRTGFFFFFFGNISFTCAFDQFNVVLLNKSFSKNYVFLTVVYYNLYNSSFWLESDWLRAFSSSTIFKRYRNCNSFTVCITPLAAFLAASVMADARIHYDFINNTVFVSRNVVFRVFKARMHLFRCQIWSLLIDITSVWKCDVLGEVSSRTSAGIQRS